MATFPDLDVRFVADLRPEAARRQAERFGVPGSGTVDEVLARDDVELIVNLTVPVAHAEVASAALAAGKHVWNEKPITADLPSAEALVAQAEAAGLLLGCAPDTFLGPGLQTVRRMLEAGAIGTPLTASVVMQYAGPHEWHENPDFLYQPGAGPLFDMGPYYLTALSQTFGAVTRVAARGGSAGPTRIIGKGPRAGAEIPVGVPTYVAALYDFDGGAVAAGDVQLRLPAAPDGRRWRSPAPRRRSPPRTRTTSPATSGSAAAAPEWETVPVTGVAGGRGIGAVDMARAIRGGGAHRATGRLGLHVLETMLATAASIETAAFVPVAGRFEPSPALPADWDPTARTL